MTFEQAIAAMREGKKVTHRYYTHDEWTTIEVDEKVQVALNDFVVDENGHKIRLYEFMANRHRPAWETDWSIWTGEKYEDPRDNPLIGEDDWIHDSDMGAR